MHRVGTDGVLLGAWVDVTDCRTILDVGAGTAIIALMLAQRTDAEIRALEPDTEAFLIAQANIETSPFNNKLLVHQTTLQNFSTEGKFDLIVCNPPYFEKSLKPPTAARQNQRHTDALPFTDLINKSKSLLQPTGRLAVVMPYWEGNRFKDLAAHNNLHLSRTCAVTAKAGKPQERWLLEFSLAPSALRHEVLTLMDTTGQWTPEYQQLTRSFYLKF